MLRTRALATVALRQRFAVPVCQRMLHTSVRLNTAEGNLGEALANKFTGQVKKTRNSVVEPTRFVKIDTLPITATTEDIRKLAREAFSDGDKSIIEIVFCRNEEFGFYGRCVVLMSKPEDARRLINYGNRRLVGGNIIKMAYTGSPNSSPSNVMNNIRPSQFTSMADSTSASGRSVVFTGLPPKTLPEHLLGYLRSRNFFPIEGAHDNVVPLKTKNKSTVSKFLVKFDSESEAWRCVRAFHNTDFVLEHTKEKFGLQVGVAY